MTNRFWMELAAVAAALWLAPAWSLPVIAQPAQVRLPAPAPAVQPPAAAASLQPDAARTKEELNALLERHSPALRTILALDPTLLNSPSYLAPYPAIASFLAAHPEIARDPAFYFDNPRERRRTPPERMFDFWNDVLAAFAALLGAGLAIGLLSWLVKTLIDYRRWSRIAKVQSDFHAKILDRLASSEDLLAYIQSPAGAGFLQSSPIHLDAGPRSVAAPLGRILWSVQGGVLLIAAGAGLWAVSARLEPALAQPLHSFGILALALGLGFVLSAAVSYVLSRRLGLVAPAPDAPAEPPSA